jgi:hypothetical protein
VLALQQRRTSARANFAEASTGVVPEHSGSGTTIRDVASVAERRILIAHHPNLDGQLVATQSDRPSWVTKRLSITSRGQRLFLHDATLSRPATKVVFVNVKSVLRC